MLCVCSFEDSPSEAADPETAASPVAPHRPSTIPGASGADKAATEAQQAKHASTGGGRLPKGPPQQSRCQWQLKGSAQVGLALSRGCSLLVMLGRQVFQRICSCGSKILKQFCAVPCLGFLHLQLVLLRVTGSAFLICVRDICAFECFNALLMTPQ